MIHCMILHLMCVLKDCVCCGKLSSQRKPLVCYLKVFVDLIVSQHVICAHL